MTIVSLKYHLLRFLALRRVFVLMIISKDWKCVDILGIYDRLFLFFFFLIRYFCSSCSILIFIKCALHIYPNLKTRRHFYRKITFCIEKRDPISIPKKWFSWIIGNGWYFIWKVFWWNQKKNCLHHKNNRKNDYVLVSGESKTSIDSKRFSTWNKIDYLNIAYNQEKFENVRKMSSIYRCLNVQKLEFF